MLGHRTLIYLLFAAFLGGFTAYVISVVRKAEPRQAELKPPVLKPNILDGEIITLDRVALDSAYRAQMGILFGTWLKDASDGPERAKIGARYARQAYLDVREALDKREAEFNARFGYVEKQCK